MRRLFAPSSAFLAVSSGTCIQHAAVGRDAVESTRQELRITTSFKGSKAVLTADAAHFAGAVTSFTWNGAEFIDRRDHGRLLQAAVTFDDLGECYNPTEAGSAADATGRTSSSKVLQATNADGSLHTKVDAAFWLAPGATALHGCGLDRNSSTAVNMWTLGNYTISKQVKFGYKGIPNAINWMTRFDVPSAHKSAVFETVTAYMPLRFSNFQEISYEEKHFKTLPRPSGTGIRPLVFSTADGQYAMGIVCPSAKPTRYAYIRFNDVVKLNCTTRIENISAKSYDFHAILYFGSREDVESAIFESLAAK